MSEVQPTNRIGSELKRGVSAFLILILFTLSLFIKQSEAGWIHTESEDFAVKFIHMIRAGDLAEINKHLVPALLSEENQKQIQNAIDVFPKRTIEEITRLQINVNYGTGNQGRTEEFQFFILMDTTALIMDEVLQKEGDRFVVHGFHFNPAPMNTMKHFPFTLISWIQPKNVFLAVGVFNAIFMTVVLVLWFIKPIKMKLLWLPVIFTGVMKVSAQWVDDGPWAFNLLAVRFPSAWIETAGQDPWSIIVSLPLGAAVVLLLAITATPDPETVMMPTRPQNGMPRRTQVQPRQRPRPQPTKVGK
jgi:hypothetical protein